MSGSCGIWLSACSRYGVICLVGVIQLAFLTCIWSAKYVAAKKATTYFCSIVDGLKIWFGGWVVRLLVLGKDKVLLYVHVRYTGQAISQIALKFRTNWKNALCSVFHVFCWVWKKDFIEQWIMQEFNQLFIAPANGSSAKVSLSCLVDVLLLLLRHLIFRRQMLKKKQICGSISTRWLGICQWRWMKV